MSAINNGQASFSVKSISQTAPRLPNRVILHGLAGWGKTSFAAQVPGVVFLLVGQETGLWTLMDSGEVGNGVAHFPQPAASVSHVLTSLQSLIDDKHEYTAIAIDSITALEALMANNVCERKFRGDWSDFYSYGGDQSAKMVALEWEPIIRKMEEVRNRGVGIFLLSHSRVVKFQNPEGADYERWESLTKHSWNRLSMWSDMVMFGSWDQVVTKKDKKKSDAESKGKAIGDAKRVMYCERRGAFDAKNRHGLPAEIDCGNSPAEAWANFRSAMTAKKTK
jgi:hypothetical protein